MKKTIRVADEKKGIIQITTVDERFYVKPTNDTKTGLPSYQYVPSVSWITHFYHKPDELLRYYGNRGYDEAKQIMHEAGDKGTRCHAAISCLLNGLTITMETKFPSELTEQMEELTVDEWDAIYWFQQWFEET